MQQFLRYYLAQNKGKSIDYKKLQTDWNTFADTVIVDDDKKAAAKTVDWDEWLFKPGMPDKKKYGDVLNFVTNDQIEAEKLADDYITSRGKTTPDAAKDWTDPTKYYANKKVLFLNKLIERRRELNVQIIEKLDKDLKITEEKNYEIGQRWFPLAIMHGYIPAFPAAQTFISK